MIFGSKEPRILSENSEAPLYSESPSNFVVRASQFLRLERVIVPDVKEQPCAVRHRKALIRDKYNFEVVTVQKELQGIGPAYHMTDDGSRLSMDSHDNIGSDANHFRHQ